MTDDAEEPAPRKLLTRSRRQKVIGGVCGGLGRYFGIDPVIFRVVLAILALTGGVGLISYGIGWLLIPMDGADETELRRLLSGRIEGGSMTAVLCGLVGSGLFLSTIDNGQNQAFSVCLVAAVVAAVYWSQRRRAVLAAMAAMSEQADAPGGAPVPDAPPAAQPPPTDGLPWWRTPAGRVSFEKSGAGAAGPNDRYPGYMWGPADSSPDPEDLDGPARPPRPPHTAYERAPRQRSLFGLVVFLLAVVAASVGISVTWHGHALRFILEIGLVAALGVLGFGLVIGAFAGHRGGGIIGWAVLASLLLGVSATVPKSVGTDWHRTTWRPAAVAQVRPEYRLGAGQGILDLSGLALRGGTTRATVDMGAGQLQVLVPRNATVDVEAKVGLGDVRFPDSGHHDVNISPAQDRRGTFPPPDGARSGGTITLTLRLGAGQVEVLRDPAS